MPDLESRIERDALGELAVPAGALHGIHTQRALENFSLAGQPVHPQLLYGIVVGEIGTATLKTADLEDAVRNGVQARSQRKIPTR